MKRGSPVGWADLDTKREWIPWVLPFIVWDWVGPLEIVAGVDVKMGKQKIAFLKKVASGCNSSHLGIWARSRRASVHQFTGTSFCVLYLTSIEQSSGVACF